MLASFAFFLSESLLPFQIQPLTTAGCFRLMSKSAGVVVDEVAYEQKGTSPLLCKEARFYSCKLVVLGSFHSYNSLEKTLCVHG